MSKEVPKFPWYRKVPVFLMGFATGVFVSLALHVIREVNQ